MKTRDRLAIEIMHAVISANPDLIKEASHDEGGDVAVALELFAEARSQIRDKCGKDYFSDDEGKD